MLHRELMRERKSGKTRKYLRALVITDNPRHRENELVRG